METRQGDAHEGEASGRERTRRIWCMYVWVAMSDFVFWKKKSREDKGRGGGTDEKKERR